MNTRHVLLIWPHIPGLRTGHIMPNQRGPGLEWENRSVKNDCIKAASNNRATDTHKASGNGIDDSLITRSPLSNRENEK